MLGPEKQYRITWSVPRTKYSGPNISTTDRTKNNRTENLYYGPDQLLTSDPDIQSRSYFWWCLYVKIYFEINLWTEKWLFNSDLKWEFEIRMTLNDWFELKVRHARQLFLNIKKTGQSYGTLHLDENNFLHDLISEKSSFLKDRRIKLREIL